VLPLRTIAAEALNADNAKVPATINALASTLFNVVIVGFLLMKRASPLDNKALDTLVPLITDRDLFSGSGPCRRICDFSAPSEAEHFRLDLFKCDGSFHLWGREMPDTRVIGRTLATSRYSPRSAAPHRFLSGCFCMIVPPNRSTKDWAVQKIGNAPTIAGFAFSGNCTVSVSRLNVSRLMKIHDSAAQSNV
jgi:hypothetical protein